jgi:hypothetical protein
VTGDSKPLETGIRKWDRRILGTAYVSDKLTGVQNQTLFMLLKEELGTITELNLLSVGQNSEF